MNTGFGECFPAEKFLNMRKITWSSFLEAVGI